MKRIKNCEIAQIKSAMICMSLLPHLDLSLPALEKFIFFRLLVCYGFKKINKGEINGIAARVGVDLLGFEKILLNLIQTGHIEEVNQTYFRVNKHLINLTNQPLVNSSKFRLNKNKLNMLSYIHKHKPLFSFFLHLVNIIFIVKINIKKRKKINSIDINYQEWLILINLVDLSDIHGIALNADIHSLGVRTGLKHNMVRMILRKFISKGVLRSKINGTLNNNLLRTVSAVYCINLSHDIWGSNKIFGKFFIIDFPKFYDPYIERIMSVLNGSLLQTEGDENSREILKYIYLLLEMGRFYDKDFDQHLKLQIHNNKPLLNRINNYNDNLNRISYMIYYNFLSLIPILKHINNLRFSLDQSKTIMEIFFNKIRRSLKSFSAIDSHDFDTKGVSVVEMDYVVESLRSDILFACIKMCFDNEIGRILSKYYNEFDKSELSYLMLTILPYSFVKSHRYILFHIDKSKKCDEFEFITFNQTLATNILDVATMEVEQCTLTIEQQFERGLLGNK